MLSLDAIDKARHVDLLALIGADTTLRKVANTRGGEYAGPCPFCGGRDRLRVQPERGRWWCRQCGGKHWLDAIAYVRKRDHTSFEEACRRLSGDIVPQLNQTTTATTIQMNESMTIACPPSAKWQSRAKEIIVECESNLWNDSGAKARACLFDQRGLREATWRAWHIGYNPTHRREDPRLWGFDSGKRIYVPRGIVIPYEVNGTLWSVKIRRPVGNPKYLQPRGSVPALFGADTLGRHDYAVLTEGEFDALLVWQSFQQASNVEWHKMGVATLGSATNSIDIDTWANYLLPVSRLLVCYDTDKEGVRGSERWKTLTSRARRIVVPTLRSGDKDLTDFHRSGGDILDLIAFEIARDEWEQEQEVSRNVAQVAQAAQVAQSAEQILDDLRTRREAIIAQWNHLFDQLEAMNQDSGEFEALFAEWAQIDEAYKRLDDLYHERLEANLMNAQHDAKQAEEIAQ